MKSWYVFGLLALVLFGCDERVAAPQNWGHAPCFSADVVVRIVPPQGDPDTVSVAVERRDDGRVRVDVAKLDVQAANMVLEPDGACTVWLPRAQRVARTAAHAAPEQGLPLIAAVRLMAAELADGPDATLAPELAWNVQSLPRDADGHPVAKRVYEADGSLRCVVTYERWATFGDVERPSRCRIELTDGTIMHLRLRSLRVLGGISAERFRLDIPATAEVIPWSRLGDALAE